MVSLVWINNLLLFKLEKKYSTQYRCVCSEQYINELDMKINDILFVKDTIKPNSYKRLGFIKAINNKTVIVGILPDIGIGSKIKMQKTHDMWQQENPDLVNEFKID